jgi:hypothetical protein
MTLSQARKLLPQFAVGLGIYARSVGVLRDAVLQEIEIAKGGLNPLTEKQLAALKKFLARTK